MPNGYTALSLLCNARDRGNKRIPLLEHWVEARADLECRTPQGMTPLLSACACGFKAAVQLLLDARSDHNAQNNRPKNAMGVVPKDQQKGATSQLVSIRMCMSEARLKGVKRF